MSVSSLFNPQSLYADRSSAFSAGVKRQTEFRITSLYDQLQGSISQVNSTQNEMSQIEKEFLREQEVLTTELLKIDIDAEIKSSDMRQKHVETIDQIRLEFSEKISSPKQLKFSARDDFFIPPSNFSASNSSFANLQPKYLDDENLDSEFDEFYETNSVSQLENEKSQLEASVAEENRKYRDDLLNLTVSLDSFLVESSEELNDYQNKLKDNEQKYLEGVQKLFNELNQIKSTKDKLRQRQEETFSKIEAQMKEMESDFTEKLQDAKRVAEKMKAKLQNLNTQKQIQIELERKRTEDFVKLLEEKRKLEKEKFKLKEQVDRARSANFQLQQSMSSTLGARRASSFFD